jgi:hypothetical protein
MTTRHSALFCALLAALLLLATSATAVSISVGREGGTTWELTDPLVADSSLSDPDENDVATWALDGPFVKATYTLDSMMVELKEDPFVTNNLTLTNTTSSTQTFIVSVLLPITAFAYDATIASSVGVTVTNNLSTSVAASSVSPDGIYTGTVNGSGILTLMPHLTTVTCGTTGCSTTSSDLSAVPQLAAGPGVATSIGIILKFSLSAFDSVAITSRFEIISVPEPSALLLLVVGLPALAYARRHAS